MSKFAAEKATIASLELVQADALHYLRRWVTRLEELEYLPGRGLEIGNAAREMKRRFARAADVLEHGDPTP